MRDIKHTEDERNFLENKFNQLIAKIGDIPIATTEIMPLGWRKAAKGRTVWRIVEEIINQNLEVNCKKLGFLDVKSAESEVDVFDMEFTYFNGEKSYVNIKSAVLGGKRNKDDISKADGLERFFNKTDADLYIATFVIRFNDNMTLSIDECVVCPITWIPDIYINPSNNGNLQSAYYKDPSKYIKRTKDEFKQLFLSEYNVAMAKKKKKADFN